MSRRRKIVPVLAVAAALVAVAVMAAYFVTRAPAGTPASATATASASATGTTGAATATRAAPATSIAETNAPASAANPSSGQTVATDEPVVLDGTQVSVELTSWGWNAAQRSAQARGYASGVVEGGGTCTLTLTRDGRSVTADTEATPDASTTACGSVAVAGDRLAPGTWQAVMSYDSPTSAGSSAPVQIVVP
jgi:hypothetical protein